MVVQQGEEFLKVCDILKHHQYNPNKLIPILQEVQEAYRYLPEEVMTFVATSLGISSAKVYGVASFYAHFTMEPKGKYVIKICDGTACHVKKSTDILDAIRDRLSLPEGRDTTADMLFTVETVSCLGACGLAPAIVINEDVHGLMTPKSAVEVLDDMIAKENAKNG